jgi:predicted nucleotidyltransferase
LFIFRRLYDLTENVKKILKKEFPYLAARYGVKKIGLFGSFAKGKQTTKSDIDIIVEFRKPIGFRFIELCDYFEKRLGKKIDILTPAGIKSIRHKHVAEIIKRSVVYV